MQGLPIELGGFRGRTNKLVDGCYSWWVGGCVGLVETVLGMHEGAGTEENEDSQEEEDVHKTWDDADGELRPVILPLPRAQRAHTLFLFRDL